MDTRPFLRMTEFNYCKVRRSGRDFVAKVMAVGMVSFGFVSWCCGREMRFSISGPRSSSFKARVNDTGK